MLCVRGVGPGYRRISYQRNVELDEDPGTEHTTGARLLRLYFTII